MSQAKSDITRVRSRALDRSSLTDLEVRSIIDRVKGRVAAAEFAEHTGPTLRAGDDLAISDVELVDGIHAPIGEADQALFQIAFTQGGQGGTNGTDAGQDNALGRLLGKLAAGGCLAGLGPDAGAGIENRLDVADPIGNNTDPWRHQARVAINFN